MISPGKRKRQVKMIKLQYEELSETWGYDINSLVKSFEKRFKEAVENKANMDIFFKAENEAIKIFEEKLREMADEEEAEEAIEAAKVSDEENDTIKPSIPSAFEASYTNYNRIKIDLKASPEIEYLFGAMVDYRLNLLPVLEESRRLIRDKAYQTMSYEIENLLTDLGDNQNGRLPTVFSVYKVKIERAKGADEIERARMEPFKATVNIVRKIKRLGRWAENHHLKIPSHVHLKYREQDCNFRTFVEYLVKDFDMLTRNFGLQAFLEG